MEVHSPPSKVARLADNNGTPGMEEAGGETTVGLDLGLGPGNDQGKSIFTFFQLQELEHQALIYKYMAAGIPVPSHLVLPIWKSLGSTYAGTGIYPSFLGSRGVCYDYRNSMEPEPGRCRRTDGKKWRCSKDVVPQQKYCERHMHRGRNRSRKHVEATSTAAATTATSTNTNGSSTTSQAITIASLPSNYSSVSSNGTINSTNYVSQVLSPKSMLQEGSMCEAESS